MSKFKVGDVITPIGESTEFVVTMNDVSVYRLKELKTGVEFPTAIFYVDHIFQLSRRIVSPHPDHLVPSDQVIDTKVMLEGIPEGYCLKSFRLAGPQDLIIKTNGKVCLGDEGYAGRGLFRPIIKKIALWKSSLPGVPDGYEPVRHGIAKEGESFVYINGKVVSDMDAWTECEYLIVRKISDFPVCDGTLPGIPKGFKVLRFGDVKADEFYYDSIGNLKRGPSSHRIALAKRQVLGTALNSAAEGERVWVGIDWASAIVDLPAAWTNAANNVKFEHEYSVSGMAVYSQFKIDSLNATGKSRKVKVL